MPHSAGLRAIAYSGAFALAACVSTQARDRPENWPAPLFSNAGLCTPISGRFIDSPVDEVSGPEPKYVASSLAALLIWQLWRKESGPRAIVHGKATVAEVAISASGATVSAFGPSGRLAAYSSPAGQTIVCENGYFVFDRQLSGSSEGTTSQSTWKLYIAVTASGDLIAREYRAAYQRTMLLINTSSASDRWYRFVPEK